MARPCTGVTREAMPQLVSARKRNGGPGGAREARRRPDRRGRRARRRAGTMQDRSEAISRAPRKGRTPPGTARRPERRRPACRRPTLSSSGVRVRDDDESGALQPGGQPQHVGVRLIRDLDDLVRRAGAGGFRRIVTIRVRLDGDEVVETAGARMGGPATHVLEPFLCRHRVRNAGGAVHDAYARQSRAILVDQHPLIAIDQRHLGITVKLQRGRPAGHDDIVDGSEVDQRRSRHRDVLHGGIQRTGPDRFPKQLETAERKPGDATYVRKVEQHRSERKSNGRWDGEDPSPVAVNVFAELLHRGGRWPREDRRRALARQRHHDAQLLENGDERDPDPAPAREPRARDDAACQHDEHGHDRREHEPNDAGLLMEGRS